MKLIYKTPLRVVAAILCVLLISTGVLAAVPLALSALVGTSVDAMEYSLLTEKLQRDAYDILYVWQQDNLNADGSLRDGTEFKQNHDYNGSMYTGKGSNVRYTISGGDSGETVYGTLNGEETIYAVTAHDYYTIAEPDELVSDETGYEAESELLHIGALYYQYNRDEDCFVLLDSDIYVDDAFDLPADAAATGFTFMGGYYTCSSAVSGFYRLGNSGDTIESYTEVKYTITASLLKGMPENDAYRSIHVVCSELASVMWIMPWIMGTCLLLGVALLILLCVATGHRASDGTLYLSPLHIIPGDLSLAVFAGVCTVTLGLMASFDKFSLLSYWLGGVVVLFLCCGMTGVYCIVSFAARLKNHAVWRTTILCRLFRLAVKLLKWVLRCVKKLLGLFPFLWKIAACWVALCIVELFLMAIWSVDGDSVFLWFVEKLLLTCALGYISIMLWRLRQGVRAIASGEYGAEVNQKHMVLDLKETAEDLNHISGGMDAAVESRMRSERLKTELITNVSHDLKTPLTAIVSYVDLLKQEPAGSEQAAEYIEVLDRQSQRLKRLTEDLVEASKASTGNVELQMAELNAAMLLEQAVGEYTARLEQAGLQVVLQGVDGTDDDVTIRADGRHLWRVFDNLLNNAVKYAMPGTRMYAAVTGGEQVSITFRNISREQLNVTAEELLERFVRGDASRHTEGSGLGLSIARSLTEAMGGTFLLEVDGDLFKATVRFPKA